MNLSPVKQNASIDLSGASAAKYSAEAATLSSQDLDAENSIAEPMRVAPVDKKLAPVGSNFQYEMEGNSFTVLKLVPQK